MDVLVFFRMYEIAVKGLKIWLHSHFAITKIPEQHPMALEPLKKM